jgi:hypothetical protein
MPHEAALPSALFGREGWRVDDCRGRLIGTLEAVYALPGSAAPAWLLVRLEGWSSRYVLTPPSESLTWLGRITLPWDRARVEGAPLHYTPPGEVGEETAADLARHFRLGGGADVPMSVRRSIA